MILKECKRLTEVKFPISEVSRRAAREKSIWHGHPSILHPWWARRLLSRTGAELLFEVFSQRYERGSVLVTTSLPFDEWTEASTQSVSPERCWTGSPITSTSWR